jgi:hypothetical protein
MRSLRLIPTLLALAAIGCGAPPPRNEEAAASVTPQEGRLPPLTETVRMANRADLLPPDAVIGSDSPSGNAETIAFQSRNPPSRLLAWYRSAERGFQLGSELREGAEYVLSGSTRAADRNFTVRLAPAPGGGTSGMVLFTDR